jgi:multiple sugar transport system substrate-binding protein
MKFPAVPGAVCPNCRTLSVQGSYVANADTKRKKEVLAFFNSMATEEAAIAGSQGAGADRHQDRSLEDSRASTRVLQDARAANQGATYYFGAPTQVMQGKAKEVFTQVVNNALPAGTISVEDAVRQLAASY